MRFVKHPFAPVTLSAFSFPSFSGGIASVAKMIQILA
jgi:hypothetical protein